MILKIFAENPASRHIKKLTEAFNEGEVIISPTDTVYALAGDLYQPKVFEKMELIKGGRKAKKDFSIIVSNISMLSEYTKPLDNSIFRLIKRNTPGAFTFILEANSSVPKLFQSKKKTIGIRIPDNKLLTEIVETLGHPLVTTSIHDDDIIVDYTTDPHLIHDKYAKKVAWVVDGGTGKNEGSTIVDCTGSEPVILRQGIGVLKD